MTEHEHFRDWDPWDWDAWVASRTAEHVEGIAERIRNSPEAVAWRAARVARLRAEAKRSRARITIDHETGTMPRGLCWVCAGERVELATRTSPTFRACRSCRIYDLKQGQRLGLKMVLPLVEYPTPMVAPGGSFPTDPATVAAVRQVWSQVSVLDAWRSSVVRAVLARQAWPEGERITVDEFAAFLPPLPYRSRMAWWAYVDRHQPLLAEVLDALPSAEQMRRPVGT